MFSTKSLIVPAFAMLGAGGVFAAAPQTTVALTNAAAPAPSGSATYTNDFRRAVINDFGTVSFFAGSSDSGGAFSAIYTGTPGSLQRLVRTGDVMPGQSAAVTAVDARLITSSNQVVFRATEPSPPSANGGYWVGTPGNVTRFLQQFQLPPGLPPADGNKVNLGSFPERINGSGQILFGTNLLLLEGTATSLDNRILYGGTVSAPTIVARRGSQVPGLPAETNWNTPTEQAINDAGFAVGTTTLIAAPGSGLAIDSTNDQALFSVSGGVPTVFARLTDPAPDLPSGSLWRELNVSGSVTQLAADNQVALLASTVKDSVRTNRIFAGSTNDLHVWLSQGDAAPGIANATIADFGPAVYGIANGGVVFAPVNLAQNGTTVTSSNDQVVYMGTEDNLSILFRKGDPVPELDGVTFSSVTLQRNINDAGQAIFTANLGGTVTSATDRAIFSYDPAGGIHLIAREGDSIEVAPGDFRTIKDNGITLDFSRGLGDSGQFVYILGFTGTGSPSGVFTSNVVVPEPATIGLLGLATGILLKRRRRA